MWLYLFIFLVPVIFYIINSSKDSKSELLLAFFLLCLSLFVGFSDMFGGYDRYIYGEIFDNIADITTAKGDYLKNEEVFYYGSEIGYMVLNILISFITENRYIFILVVTLIIYICLFFSLKRYTDNYPLAIILFLGLWFFFTFTYLRQVLSATIVWLSIQYIINRKFWRFLIIFLIGFSIHNSAIIFFPLYFIPIKKYSPQKIISVMLFIFVIGLSPLPNSLFEIYGNNSILERHAEYNSSGSFRIPYILESFFFLFLILRNYSSIPNERFRIVLMNMALIFCAILLFFVRSENGGRLSWYYMIGIISTITFIGSCKINIRKGIPLFLIGLSLFLYLRIYTSWQVYLNLYPYKTFFTNGFREGDFSWQHYEYNHAYDEDKFCRKPFRLVSNI